MREKRNVPFIDYLLSHGKLKYIGEPCADAPHHVGLRYVKHNSCVECTMFQNTGIEASESLAWVNDAAQRDVFTVPFQKFRAAEIPLADRRRNKSAARRAMSDGERFFDGSPCRFCGCTLRFADTCSCVACEKMQRATVAGLKDTVVFINPDHQIDFVNGRFVPVLTLQMDRDVRDNAEILQLATYTGMPCKTCNNTKRYTNRGQCVACVKARNDAKKKPATAKTEAGSNFDSLFD